MEASLTTPGEDARHERPRRLSRPGDRVRASQRLLFALDAALVVLAVVAARLSGATQDAPLTPAGWTVLFVVLVLANLFLAGAYRPRFVLHFLDDVRLILGATAIAAMVVVFIRLLGTNDPETAPQASRLWLFAAAYLIAGRGAHGLIRARARKVSGAGEATLIVGAGYVGHSIAKRLLDRPEFGLRPVAFLDDEPLNPEGPGGLPVLRVDPGGSLVDRLAEAIQERRIEHVVLGFSLASHDEELALVRRCKELGASISLVPRLFEGVTDQTRLERIGGIPLVSLRPTDPRAWQFQVKYVIDRLVAAIALVILSPLFCAAALGTLLSAGRPILFRQERVGLDGRAFQMLKFRTMRGDPQEHGEADADWAAAALGTGQSGERPVGSSRVTRFGALLRKASLDELPQLLNVLKGEMSLVGPRPERRAYVELFERTIRRYDDRHRVKSGMTGWAQVNGLRGETSLADRVEWDNYYIENWSPWLDLKIVLLTLRAFASSSG